MKSVNFFAPYCLICKREKWQKKKKNPKQKTRLDKYNKKVFIFKEHKGYISPGAGSPMPPGDITRLILSNSIWEGPEKESRLQTSSVTPEAIYSARDNGAWYQTMVRCREEKPREQS